MQITNTSANPIRLRRLIAPKLSVLVPANGSVTVPFEAMIVIEAIKYNVSTNTSTLSVDLSWPEFSDWMQVRNIRYNLSSLSETGVSIK